MASSPIMVGTLWWHETAHFVEARKGRERWVKEGEKEGGRGERERGKQSPIILFMDMSPKTRTSDCPSLKLPDSL